MKIKNYLRSDLPASLVVFLVALPLCLGVALASGAPLLSGLMAGILGGTVVGMLSASPMSVSGPAAGLTTIVLSAIATLGSYQAFLLSLVLAGLLQIALGFIRAGSIGNFFPASVIKGMLAAIGVILILKQIPHAIGYDVDFEGDESFIQGDTRNTFTEILESIQHFSGGAIIIGAISILILILWGMRSLQRFQFIRTMPSSLVVVVLGILLNLLFESWIPSLAIDKRHMVSLPLLSDSSDLNSFIMFPDFSLIFDSQIYVVAVTLAVVASLETLLSIEACDKLDPYRRITPLNRELKAQGTANMISGLLGGLPVTSVIVRSSANINAGAKTKASTITHGIILLLAVITIPRVLQKIPLACLAGILIFTGFKLTLPELYKDMYRKGVSQFLPFVVTVVAVIFTDLLQGVFCGMLVGIFFILKTNFQESVIMVNDDNNYLIRFTKDVSFLNKGTLRNIFLKIPDHSFVTVDGSQAQFVDNDIKETIANFVETSKVKYIEVELKNIRI